MMLFEQLLLSYLFLFLSVSILFSSLSYGTTSNDQHSRLRSFGKDHQLAGLVLARCGSKGIRMKNLAKIGTESLLQRTLNTMRISGRFSSLWVATDCNKIAEEAFLSGAQVFWRSPESASDKAPSIIAIKEFLSHKPEIQVVALFQCTSPFLAVPFIHSAFALVEEGFDSVFSVSRQYKLRWHVHSDGHAEAVNFDPAQRPRRQDWSGELVENGMFYFIARDVVSKGYLQGGRIGVVEVPANCSLEIDTQADLEVAVALAASLASRSGSSGGGGSGGRRC